MHLHGIGPYIAARDVVQFLSAPEMKSHLGLDKPVSVHTVQHWLHIMGYNWQNKRRVSILMDMNARMLSIIVRGCFSWPLRGMQSQCESGMTMGRRKSLHHLLKDTLLSGSMMNRSFMLTIVAKFAGFMILSLQSPMPRVMVRL